MTACLLIGSRQLDSGYGRSSGELENESVAGLQRALGREMALKMPTLGGGVE